jgi:hypothetical protein
MWLHKTTKRRITVSWATRTQVKAMFNDTAFKVYSVDGFLSLFEPIL